MDYEIINIIYDLVDEIKKTDCYKEYKRLESLLENKYVDLIKKLKVIKKELNSLYKYSNEYKLKYQELLNIKEIFYNDEDYVNYKLNERQINDLLGNINKEIAKSISNNINYVNELGIII